MTHVGADRAAIAVVLADRALRGWLAAAGASEASPRSSDPGPALLAMLLAEADDTSASRDLARRALTDWAHGVGRGQRAASLHSGGLAGVLAGLRLGAATLPGLGAHADRLADRLREVDAARRWRRREVAFTDYDLITGPAGCLLARCVAASPSRDDIDPYLRQLLALTAEPDLSRLRVGAYQDHPLLGWTQGHVNIGMGHGLAGVLCALTAALRRVGPEPELVAAVRRVAGWLRVRSYQDPLGIRTWQPADLPDGPPAAAQPRQAWCYGAPGVVWALWDAADALADRELADWSLAAFASFAAGFDERFHLPGRDVADQLALCHGAAGVLAVADALRRHAGLAAAGEVRERAASHLLARADEVEALTARNLALLGGGAGVIAALLTAAGGDRGWLPCLGLR